MTLWRALNNLSEHIMSSVRSRSKSSESVQRMSTRSDSNEIKCSICFGALNRSSLEVKKLPVCGHDFHKICVDKWLLNHNTCPLCRTEVQPLTCMICKLPKGAERITTLACGHIYHAGRNCEQSLTAYVKVDDDAVFCGIKCPCDQISWMPLNVRIINQVRKGICEIEINEGNNSLYYKNNAVRIISGDAPEFNYICDSNESTMRCVSNAAKQIKPNKTWWKVFCDGLSCMNVPTNGQFEYAIILINHYFISNEGLSRLTERRLFGEENLMQSIEAENQRGRGRKMAPSPVGRGFLAKNEAIGARKRGGDGKMWRVAERTRNGRPFKIWTRVVQ